MYFVLVFSRLSLSFMPLELTDLNRRDSATQIPMFLTFAFGRQCLQKW